MIADDNLLWVVTVSDADDNEITLSISGKYTALSIKIAPGMTEIKLLINILTYFLNQC